MKDKKLRDAAIQIYCLWQCGLQSLWKIIQQYMLKLKYTYCLLNPEIKVPDYKVNIQRCNFGSINCSSRKLETTSMFINRGMIEYIILCLQCRILFSYRKKVNKDLCVLPWKNICDTLWGKSFKKTHVRIRSMLFHFDITKQNKY